MIKRRLLESYIERKGTTWNDPRVFMMDLQYHDIQRNRSLYYVLERAGAVERIFTSTGSRVSCQRFLLPDSSGCCGGSLTNPQQQPDEHFASLMV